MQTIPINWQDIQTVFLDMDGTLLDLHYDNHFWLEYMPERYAEKHDLSFDDAYEALMAKYLAHKGSLKWYCLDHWQETLQMDIISLKHEVADRIALRDNVIEFLDYLRALDKRVVLLTNAHNDTVKLKFSYINIAKYFDRVITSHDIGIPKEQAGFWQALEKTEPVDKAHSLFIDDNLDVLDEAKCYGIAYLLTIEKPDSKKPKMDTGDYVAIEDYQQIISE